MTLLMMRRSGGSVSISNDSRSALLQAAQDQLGDYQAFKRICRDFGLWARRDGNTSNQALRSKSTTSRTLCVNDDMGCFIDVLITRLMREERLVLPFHAFQLCYLTGPHNFDTYCRRLKELRQELRANGHRPCTKLEIRLQANLFIDELRRLVIVVLNLPKNTL